MQQGDLDDLCGLYAVINAVRLLTPELGRTRPRTIAHALQRELRANPKRRARIELGEALFSGLGLDDLVLASEALARLVSLHRGVELRVRRFEPTKAMRRDIDALWAALQSIVGERCVIVACLERSSWHWTVLKTVRRDELELFDSLKLERFDRTDCGLVRGPARLRFDPEAMITFERR